MKLYRYLLATLPLSLLLACNSGSAYPVINEEKLASAYYKEDAQWFLDNTPFFECSDKQIEQVYYYRWQLYKAHIRNVGENDYVITEFINHVPWDRDPFCTINAASMHHIYEGRWLKDRRYMDGYINYLYQQGGNNRRYSESIADASYANYLVNADSAFISRQLDSMKAQYEQWSDHWDPLRNLYYIPAMPDATEYTIASIDASGGKDGFEGGEAFRPTINSYMYGNAMAISKIAAINGDIATSRDYLQRADALKANVEKYLWNDSLQHFTDRFKVDNQYVHNWDFIRGRELAGMAPWYFGLPRDSAAFNNAWRNLTDTNHLLGPFGLRTNEPAYEYYFKQFVFFEGKPGSQWNGPSWPYQSSQAITAMANLLNDYKQQPITNTDYLKLLRLYTQQHFLPGGKINLVENYEPNKGGPIVHYYWSNHYLHSSYNNLVISGLCGIRPADGDTLVINPLVDTSIRYFCLQNINYHGHKLTVVYDSDGSKYKLGKGLTVFVDGKKTSPTQTDGRYQVALGASVLKPISKEPKNLALNISKQGYPSATASINSVPDSLYQAIDGRIWYFPEITNQWTTLGSASTKDWLAIDFGKTNSISTIRLYPVAHTGSFALPDSINVEYRNGDQWLPAKRKEAKPAALIANTGNVLNFDTFTTTAIRINFAHGKIPVSVSELECY